MTGNDWDAYALQMANPSPVFFDVSQVFRPADRVCRRHRPGTNRHCVVKGPFLVKDKTHEQLGQHRRPAR